MAYQMEQELRHMKPSHLTKLSTIIDESKSWADLLNQLSSSDGFPSFCITLETTHLIKRQSSPTLALLNHWSITGRRRPTILNLIKLLRACHLKRAEDYIWDLLHQLPRERAIANIPELDNDQSSHHDTINIDFKFKNLDTVISSIPEQCNRYSFTSIYESTNRFCHKPFDFATNSGFKIGDGRFSSVFLARTYLEDNDNQAPKTQVVAAKLLKSECNINYLVNEIRLAKKISHENILELLGISIGHGEDDSPSYICLIYPYMKNGSLLDCLNFGLRCNNGQKISWQDRLNIAFKVAKGIAYLHGFHEGVIIHRDIKTANILIGNDLSPKLGDFTLVRQLDSLKQGGTQYSQNIIGTSVYMPPEAFRGDISTKFDIFSFGVVLLELLTGLKPFDDEMNEDLLTYISDKLSDIDDNPELIGSGVESTLASRDKFLMDILDKKAGEWDFARARVMFDLALRATEVRKKDRPDISYILTTIQQVHKNEFDGIDCNNPSEASFEQFESRELANA
uniref:Interleukin-1 receptor-associated kinase 4 n=1 Tax=Aceria tosichella TaxID=561515 RepID=A0A6G1S706_9ACAR